MKKCLIIFMLCVCAGAHAETYRCTVKGQTIYADSPCAPDAKRADALQDRLSESQRIQRLEQSIKERRERNGIERRENAEFAARQQALEQQVAVESRQAAAQKQRCSNIEYDIQANQRGVARYQDFGWQKSLTQQENELKKNRETYDRSCR